MFKTTNGGYNWNEEDLSQFTTGYIKSLWFFNDSIGWAVGAATKILHTDNGGMTQIQISENVTPNLFTLHQNYPNPFNPKTIINYELSKTASIKLIIYNIKGIEIRNLMDKKQNAGSYSVEFDASDLPSGVYYYYFQFDKVTETKKMLFIK